jgi:hypothetical protein
MLEVKLTVCPAQIVEAIASDEIEIVGVTACVVVTVTLDVELPQLLVTVQV